MQKGSGRERASRPKSVQGQSVVSARPPHLEFLDRHKGTLPGIIGEAELETLNAGLNLLFARLREARRQFQEEGDAGRLGAFTALGALWQFIVLFKQPHAETLHVPVLKLLDALAALDNNAVEPIIKPTRRPGRAPSSHAHLALKGHVAGTVRRLVAAGVNHKDAYKQVAQLLQRLGVRPERGLGHITAATVRNWCNEVSADVSRQGTAAQMYETMFASSEEARFSKLSQADIRRSLENLGAIQLPRAEEKSYLTPPFSQPSLVVSRRHPLPLRSIEDANKEMAGTELLTAKECAAYRRCSERKQDRERGEGRGPPYVRDGARIFYRRADVDHFIAAHVCGGERGADATREASAVRISSDTVADRRQSPRRRGRPAMT
jgi:hypothetical protein